MNYRDILYKTITNEISNSESGLYLLESPTGSGKTTQAIKYIQNNFSSQKIYFITNQKKLLPSEERLLEGLNSERRKSLKEQILFLKSPIDTFLDVYLNDKTLGISSQFEKVHSKLIKKICLNLEGYLHNSNKDDLQSFFYESFRIQEYQFRSILKDYCKDIKNIKQLEIEKKWIGKLYPVIYLDDKNVIILTTKKFFMPLDTIFNKVRYLYNFNEKNEKQVLFIDEFDATKDEILDIIINFTNKNYKVECIRLFRKLYSSVLNWNIPIALLFDKGKDLEISQIIIDEATKIINDIKKGFSNKYIEYFELIKYPFKMRNPEQKKNFIFRDKFSLFVSSKAEVLKVKVDNFKCTSYIEKSEHKKDDIKLEDIFHNILNSINFFIRKITMLVERYCRYFNENKDIYEDKIDINTAAHSIIDRLNLGEENTNFLVTMISDHFKGKYQKTLEIDNSELKIDKRKKKYNFYSNGFSFLDLIDTDSTKLETKLYMYNYNNTPENIIASTATKYFIVGMSATSTFETVLKNYDLEYLKSTLDNRFIILKDEEKDKIRNAYINEFGNDGKYDIEVSFLNDDKSDNRKYLEEILDNIFKNESFDIKNNHKELEGKNESNTEYKFKELANLYKMYYEVIKSENMHTFIFFLSYNLDNNINLKRIVLETIDSIDKTVKYFNHNPKTIKSPPYFNIITGEHFDVTSNNNKYKEVEGYLKNGSKVFLVSCYQTIGAGVNLQYKITDEVVKLYPNLNVLNYSGSAREKDFDGCYLSKVTNVLPSPNVDAENKLNDLAKCIYAYEFLKTIDEITSKQFRDTIQSLFEAYFDLKRFNLVIGSYEKYKDICVGSAKVIAQAIGRICRTQNKNSKVKIYSSSYNKSYLANSYDKIHNIISNVEFTKILEKSIEGQKKDDKIQKENYLAHINAIKFIKAHLKWPWLDEQILSWKDIRDFTLKNPTYNGSEKFDNLYMTSDKKIKEYSFNNPYYPKFISNNMTDYRKSFSDKECGLSSVMNNKYLQEKFIEKGYAIKFEEGNRFMPPSLYNSIYKGALGETIGNIIFEKFNIKLEEITDGDIYEYFDFKIGNIYIDFKNWNFANIVDKVSQIKKIIRKNSKLKSCKIYIINLLLHLNYQDVQIDELEDVEIVVIPWLYDSKTDKFNELELEKIKNEVSYEQQKDKN